MSTKPAHIALDFLPATRTGRFDKFASAFRRLIDAIAEGKAAADQYESLVARGMGPGEASQVVFRTHFGK